MCIEQPNWERSASGCASDFKDKKSFSWGGVEGLGEKAYNYNWITIKNFLKDKKRNLDSRYCLLIKFTD